MTWIKICGTTNLEDAQLAINAGADALGFVFYENSPRNIDPNTARQIVRQLPEHVETVGVFFGQSHMDRFKIVEAVGLNAIQYYLSGERLTDEALRTAIGNETPIPFYVTLPAGWILEDEDRISGITETFAHWCDSVPSEACNPMSGDSFNTFFLDAGGLGQPGGAGKPFDWTKASPLVRTMQKKVRIVVAGGLNSFNVTEAIHTLKPYGVDVVSGVEAKPGKKDPEKMRAFVQAVREADKTA